MNILLFLLKTVMISGFLLGYYWLFLRNRSFNRYNRFFLLLIPVVSFLIPALQFNPLPGVQSPNASPSRLLAVVTGNLNETKSLTETVSNYGYRSFWKSLPWEAFLLFASSLVTLVLIFRLYQAFRYLVMLKKTTSPIVSAEARIYPVHVEGTPFSFFSSIFWNAKQDLISVENQLVLKHELYHVRQLHSLDILFLEILSAFFWFNPFIHLIRKEILTVHEFLADGFAASGANEIEYARLLLFSGSGKSPSISHPFFHNPIKRRIAMITKISKTKSGLLSRFLIIPFALLLILLFAFKTNPGHPLAGPAKRTIRVVVDAGHCKPFPGINVDGINEHELTLQIAQKIKQLASQYGVEVIMTRTNQESVGGSTNLRQDLENRAAICAREKADLFVSIHTNGNQPDQSIQDGGFEIYIPEDGSPVYAGSARLAVEISEFIGKDYKIANQLKQPKQHVFVLNHAAVPAILIECGNLSNDADRRFITDETNQKKIAEDILAGIQKYPSSNIRIGRPMKSDTSIIRIGRPIKSDTLTMVADTITLDALKQKDPKTIYLIEVDKNKNRIVAHFKDGQQAIVLIGKAMRINLDEGNSPTPANQ